MAFLHRHGGQVADWFKRWLVAASHIYLVILFGWSILQALLGDRWWLLFLVSSFAVYLFYPLPLVLAAALQTRQRELWLGLVLALGLGAATYGNLFWPRPSAALTASVGLRAMSYNVYGFNREPAAAVAAIRAADADVVALQELNPTVAAEIEKELATQYPYQLLEAQPGVAGMGIISRHPLQSLDETLPAGWIGKPQVAMLAFAGQKVTVVNFHAIPPQAGARSGVSLSQAVAQTAQIRKQSVEAIITLTEVHGPMIVLGDLNASQYSDAYRVLTAVFRDGWREAGWGLGHTFPAAPGLVQKLTRIDYIFYSTDWVAVASEVGSSGGSDHYPVIVDLVPAR